VQISVVQPSTLSARLCRPLWLRRTALDRLADLRRHHHRRRRSVKAEAALPDRTSLALARSLVSPGSSPSLNLAADELAAELNRALSELPEADREILVMRQLERLPFKDIALVLEIDASTVGKRFGRALLKLKEVMKGEAVGLKRLRQTELTVYNFAEPILLLLKGFRNESHLLSVEIRDLIAVGCFVNNERHAAATLVTTSSCPRRPVSMSMPSPWTHCGVCRRGTNANRTTRRRRLRSTHTYR
jgi:RNA polymerase sigma factor (sigma-70 family)